MDMNIKYAPINVCFAINEIRKIKEVYQICSIGIVWCL